jgi:hypothetical protein
MGLRIRLARFGRKVSALVDYSRALSCFRCLILAGLSCNLVLLAISC